ncbi:MAG: thioredoxin family protein [Anaerolineae bacterium]|nr:thioredoxin family protein [Anaerolineae bacterium]
MAIQGLPQVQEAEFDQVVLAESIPVVVEVYSPLCPHCRRLAPVIEEIAREYAGRLRFVQVDALRSPGLARRLRIAGVPAMVVLFGGRELGRIIGEMPKEALRTRLDEILAAAGQSA